MITIEERLKAMMEDRSYGTTETKLCDKHFVDFVEKARADRTLVNKDKHVIEDCPQIGVANHLSPMTILKGGCNILWGTK